MSPGWTDCWSNIGPVCRLQSSQKRVQNLSEDDSLEFFPWVQKLFLLLSADSEWLCTGKCNTKGGFMTKWCQNQNYLEEQEYLLNLASNGEKERKLKKSY